MPLNRFLHFRSRDPDESREMVARVFCDHRLDLLRGRSLDAFQYEATIGPLSLSYMQYGQRVSIHPGVLNSFYLIQMPLRGSAEIRTTGRPIVSTARLGSIADPTRDLSMRWSEDCSKLVLKIDRTAVHRYFSGMLADELPPQGVVFDPELDLTDAAGCQWMGIMRLLESHLSQFSGRKHFALASKTYEEMALSFLLLYHPHNYSSRLDRGATSQAIPRHVKKAEEFMRTFAAEPITMAEVTQAAGVSMRCLQEGFRRFRAMTPREALQRIRLDGVRADLMEGEVEGVAELALKWGFAHFGRFAGSYRKRFGELPSETLRRRQ